MKGGPLHGVAYLVLVEVVGQSSYEDLVRRVGHDGAYHASRHVYRRVLGHARHGLVVVRPPDLQTLPLEVDAIKGHRLRRLIDRPEFEEREILVQINLARQHRVAGGLRQARQMHLLVEELHHLVLGDPERDVAHVQAARLPRYRRTYNRYSCLGCVCYNVCGNLASCLHRLVLQWRNVFESRWGHIPIQRGLASAGSALLRRCRPTALPVVLAAFAAAGPRPLSVLP